MPLRTCVIGMGPIGNRHARIYQEDPLADLVAVAVGLHIAATVSLERAPLDQVANRLNPELVEKLGLPLEKGLALERELGNQVLEVAVRGAARFAGGEGRHGEGV